MQIIKAIIKVLLLEGNCFSSCRTLGFYPEVTRFGYFFAAILAPHILGELLALTFLGVIQNPHVVSGAAVLINVAGALAGSGLIR